MYDRVRLYVTVSIDNDARPPSTWRLRARAKHPLITGAAWALGVALPIRVIFSLRRRTLRSEMIERLRLKILPRPIDGRKHVPLLS